MPTSAAADDQPGAETAAAQPAAANPAQPPPDAAAAAATADALEPASDENGLIREGKAKAKAVLAASGVSMDAAAGPETAAARAERDSPAHEGAVNGASPGRKRSRSGSRKPSHTPAREKTDEEREKTKAQLACMIQRDLAGSAAVVERDSLAGALIQEIRNEQKYYHEVRQHHPAMVFGQGYNGYGNGFSDTPRGFALQYPVHSKRPGNRRARRLHLRKDEVTSQSDQVEELIPVRLDIELDKIKLRDTFTWNLHDRWTTTELFAEHLVEDFQLPPELREHVKHKVHQDLNEQITDFYPHAFFDEESLDPHLPYAAHKNDEMRVLIKLNITIGQHTLVDQFEWEINNPLNSAEEFARQMAADLSLSGEFTTAIAHSIREQCQMFTKSLYITGHPFDGRPVEDTDIRDNFLPSPIPSVFRPMQSAKDFTPYLYELNEAELERAELSIMREQRRQKRSVNRRGGPALPDLKDRQRTVRTLLVSSVLPGAAETLEGSHLFKAVRKAREGRRRGVDDDSSESDSDDSIMESPAPTQITGGTARTRGMRGAATAAQAAMRSAIGRSATPEIAALQHDPRPSRQQRYEAREESVPSEPTSLIVKLRISPAKFREWAKNPKAFLKPASTPLMVPTSLPARGTPGPNSMPPPPSPAVTNRPTPGAAASSVDSPKPPSTPTPASQGQQKWTYSVDGRADAPWPMPAVSQAPPPLWLQEALQDLREKNPGELFEATMRYSVMDTNTGSTVKFDTLSATATLPPGYKAQFLPRIRCVDCPGKLYNAGPDHTVGNFQMHLNNRGHKTNVERRTGRMAS
ncbi:SNF5-domain-containing protein [Massarina eburnea CBS 473.64]|uniref:SNF5-domain-containing protein n=1 Tax=Massarina eburnea CBS 473.64 TaxID=1395130 RepID=A0A6A6RKS9_9PLEO|nr:SNF5-domain-containing protein [Massarina eburnea CBS 473.64]